MYSKFQVFYFGADPNDRAFRNSYRNLFTRAQNLSVMHTTHTALLVADDAGLHEVMLQVTLEVEVGDLIAILAVQDGLQLGVRNDGLLVGGIAAIVVLDVLGNLLAHAGAGQQTVGTDAQEGGQLPGDATRLHEANLSILGLTLLLDHLSDTIVHAGDSLLAKINEALGGLKISNRAVKALDDGCDGIQIVDHSKRVILLLGNLLLILHQILNNYLLGLLGARLRSSRHLSRRGGRRGGLLHLGRDGDFLLVGHFAISMRIKSYLYDDDDTNTFKLF